MKVSLRFQRWLAIWMLVVLGAPPLAAIPYGQFLGGPKACAMACSLEDGPCCCQLLGIEGYDVEHSIAEHGADHQRHDYGQPRLEPPGLGCEPDSCEGALAQGPVSPPMPCEAASLVRSSKAAECARPFRPGTVQHAPDPRATAPRGPPSIRS